VLELAAIDGYVTKIGTSSMHEQLQTVTSNVFTAQADIEYLKKEHAKLALIVKELMEKKASGTPQLKSTIEHAALTQEPKEIQHHATDMSQMKNWVESKMGAWEKSESKKSDGHSEAMRALEKLRADNDSIRKKMDTVMHSLRQEGLRRESLEVDLKQVLQDQGSELKSQMRNQIASVNSELRQQKNALEQEKNARDAADKHLTTLVELRNKTMFPRHQKVQKNDPQLPVMDHVAKNMAHLAYQLEAEVASRAANLKIARPWATYLNSGDSKPNISGANPCESK